MYKKLYLKYNKLIHLFILLAVTLISYNDLRNIFFQQDEWLGLGNAIIRSETGGIRKVFSEIVGVGGGLFRFLPFTGIANYYIFNTFGLNMSLYGFLAFILLLANSWLIYLIGHKIIKSSMASLFVSLLWLTNNSASQGATWISTLVPTQFSLLFFLISVYLFISYFGQRNSRLLICSLIGMLISLWFKELGLYYAVVFLLYIWLIQDKLVVKTKLKLSGLIFIPLLVSILVPRVLALNNPPTSPSIVSEQQSIENIAYNVFLLPARALYQVHVAYTDIYQQIIFAKTTHYPEADDGVLESLVADSFLTLVSFWLLFLVALAIYFTPRKNRKIILFSLLNFFASMLPFAVFDNQIAFIEQRFFIHPAIWGSFLLVSLVYAFCMRNKRLHYVVALFVIFVPLVLFNINRLRLKLDKDSTVGNYRKEILNTVTQIKPELRDDNIFYFYTDHTGFWEFQSGFGQILAVWLYDSDKIPRTALGDQDMWDSSYEGLKYYPEGYYGYFMSYDKLLDAYLTNDEIDVENLHAFYWNVQEHSVTNSSGQIRQKIIEDLENEK